MPFKDPIRKKEYDRYYRKYKRDRVSHNKWNTINNSRRMRFKDGYVWFKDNPRTGVCSLCRKQGKTNIHHMKYHDDDPLKDTIELCVGCHRRQHKGVIRN